MSISQGLRHVADAIDRLREDGLEVDDVSVGDVSVDDGDGNSLVVDLRVSVPTGGRSRTERRAAVQGDTDGETRRAGTARTDGAGVQSVGRVQPATDDVSGDGRTTAETDDAGRPDDGEQSASAPDDERVACPVDDCEAAFETSHGMKVHRTKVHRSCDDEDPPAYRDPDRLADAYEGCESFTEMQVALDTDVSAQTVRRQTIAHGIHDPGGDEPTDGETADGETADGETVGDEPTTEGSDVTADDSSEVSSGEESRTERVLPEGMTVAELVSAVDEGMTLYDVQQRLDFDRPTAMDVLERYGLLGLVHGRVADRERREEVDAAEITRTVLERVSETGESPS